MTGAVRKKGSIRRRLIIQLLGGAALLAILMFVVVRLYARDLAADSQDEILSASVTSILDAAAVRNGTLALDIPYSAFSMLGNVSDDRVFYTVTRNDAFVTGYQDLPTPQQGRISETRFRTATYRDVEIRMVTAARRLSIAGVPEVVEVTVAQTRDGLRQTLNEISRTVAMFGIGFFLLAAFLGVLAAQSAIGPLRQLAGSVSRRGPEDLRPVTARVPEEMAPLVAALNSFMSRLKASLTRSEDLIAEAAHRVRTPLATVRTQAEITLRRVDKPENRQAVREMIRAIDESSRAAGQLLDHAMVSFRSEHLETKGVDLCRLASDAVERLRPMADLRDIDIELTLPGEPQILRGDAILLQSALLNLLDNAIKYSPTDSTVRVVVSGDGTAGRVMIRDSGKGFALGELKTLTQRFVRGGNTSGVVGSGLGLTIADEVARAHGGSLKLENAKEGIGGCASLSFLLASR
ncbi:sensor histidine kinase [Pseudoprimorskyibacter insulae]|uniref:histidine kinase n=1 Tax=Pseudoprimorskyibacter insulae TaxID=1695997 RepID=A0A2R8AZ52_9RHOB|nr:sensor histidine kinase [Pseudoprimorskyibacter insulae]SPF81124.1 Sensor protein QseC [Pseudoprimorskyibacter insulae]